MPSIIKVFFAFSLYLVSTTSSADDLFDMLKRISDANQNQNYQGTFILRKSDSLSTLQVTHGVDEDIAWESLESLSGEPRMVVRRDRQIVSVYPARELITIRQLDDKRSLHPQLPGNMDQLTLFYSMHRLDDDRIANRAALVIDLMPRDQYRYGYRYWVDKDTGMLLRCDLFDEDKAVVEQMMFTELNYLAEAPAETFNLQDYEGYQLQRLDIPETSKRTISQQQWTVNRLPKGFMLTQSILRNIQPETAFYNDATSSNATRSSVSNVALNSNESGVNTVPKNTVPSKVAPDNAVSNTAGSNTVVTEKTTEAVVDTKTGKGAGAQAGKRAEKQALLHMVYSDGLASVSVFIEKYQAAANHLQGASSMGAVNAYGNAVDAYFVTVVGEVPAKTVQAMAQSTVKIPQTQTTE